MSAMQTHTDRGSSLHMLRAMVGIGLFCALLIVLTFQGTLPRIEQLRAEALEKAIFKVLPGATTKETYVLSEDTLAIAEEEAEGQLVYVGYDSTGALSGIAVEASGMGFADVLRILYGYNPEQQTIIGFHVLESKETPGLGDKIEKDESFLANFEALDVSLADDGGLKNIVTTVKHGEKEQPWEIDGITGATISSRAIGDIIGASTQEVIPILHANKEELGMPTDTMKNRKQ
jgi:electron transport complex protein RnfG